MRAAPAERLAALDAVFVALDRPGARFEVGGILELERAPLLRDGRLDRDRLVALVERVVERLPRYRQRLGHVPLLGHPTWEPDPHFQLACHVRFATLPAPGGRAALERWTGELFAQGLPRERAPWQLWWVDDPATDTVALVAKVHHALLDGAVGVRIVHELAADGAGAPPPDEAPATPREPATLLAELRHRATALAHLPRAMPASLTALAPIAVKLVARGLRGAPDLGLDARPASPHGIVPFDLDLAELHRLRAITGATINDLVLAIVAGGLRRALLRRGVATARLARATAMVPASTRARDDHAVSGNRVALMLVPLPVDEDEPAARVARLRSTTAGMRGHGHDADAGEALVRLADATTPMLLARLLELALARRAFNIVATNMPGPAEPIALAGARVRGFYPIVNLWPGQGVGLAFLSYAGRLFGTVHGLREVIDPAQLAADLRAAADELSATYPRTPERATA